MLISSLLGILIGAVLGLTGAGGGILAVPALVAGMGWTMQQAAPIALIAVAGGAAVGAVEGWRRKLVRYRAAMLMAATGVPLTALGVRVAQAVPQQWLMGVFAAVMLLAAAHLLRRSAVHTTRHAAAPSRLGQINAETGRFDWSWSTGLLLAAIGALTGFMTGLLGVGGGFVVVPMLRRFTNVSMHGIVATSLLVVALVGTGGVLAALLHGAVVPFEATAFFSMATVAGMVAGRLAAQHLSAHRVQQGFAGVLLVVALGLLVKAAGGF
ncbi:MAG TPA: sulfite exporter TauE/SafE family protein [Burkholderiaceae bacterium]|nr:sulfite exporter TauE/SafE family protein [Burkholderiaceae bacterium]